MQCCSKFMTKKQREQVTLSVSSVHMIGWFLERVNFKCIKCTYDWLILGESEPSLKISRKFFFQKNLAKFSLTLSKGLRFSQADDSKLSILTEQQAVAHHSQNNMHGHSQWQWRTTHRTTGMDTVGKTLHMIESDPCRNTADRKFIS